MASALPLRPASHDYEKHASPPQPGRPRERTSVRLSVAANGSSGRLVVGVDFGTTYSGWPGGNGITSDKVPTELSYDGATSKKSPANRDDDLEQEESTTLDGVRWGFQLRPGEQRLRCFKLFLDRNQRLPHFVSPLDTASLLKKANRNVMDAVTDYLTLIYRHTMETLTRRYGGAFLSKTRVDFVLTVPAVWSDAAKHATLLAAERAGMGSRDSLRIISEPEAAAVYTFKALQPSFLRIDDNFIVCDAGGGTVDLIAYRITQLEPLQVEESAIGDGGLCGSAFLNYRFEDHVRARIGEERYANMREKKPKTWQMGLKHFEEFVKRNFTDDSASDSDSEDQEINIPFPGLPDDEDVGLDSGFLTMTPQQVKDIFAPVVAQVVTLVQEQVDSIRSKDGTVSSIILVGGFGQSGYLYSQLKAHFNTAPPPPYTERPTHSASDLPVGTSIEVMQPLNAWTAVVRGAALRGLDPDTPTAGLVQQRKARWHYGTTYATVYDPAKHGSAERYWSPLWERWMVADRMQWHIAKGQALDSAVPVRFHYTRNFRPGQSLVVEDELLACDVDDAPAALDAKCVVGVCTLTTDLRAVPKTLFTRLTTSDGVEFDNLDFTLDMIVESASLLFELRVDGVRYGKVVADFH
ncbi:hypothetical protein FH972_022446 [Carpinus fangiana]|uniref:Actin-like ATPase domain-containing protein n=1 Tax=Carpinus fangiana TaxID=176857 RepID=A0A5N6KSA6_9ROSI|nr:hypothetical protein FH972_022446 [Carpinus fangiana]